MRRLISRGIFACCLALSTLLSTLPGRAAAQPVALDFELAGDKGFVRLSTLAPQVTLINFWRSDCPPCVREMPLLAEVAQSEAAKGGGARVLAVAVQRPSETKNAPDIVRNALKPPLLLLYAPSTPAGLLARFGNPQQALPHTVVLDANRRLCAVTRGELSREWIDKAVAQCASVNNDKR